MAVLSYFKRRVNIGYCYKQLIDSKIYPSFIYIGLVLSLEKVCM